MSLFPEENISTRVIESWKVFADSLKSEEVKKLFLEMLEKCHKYALAINAKGRPFPTEPLIMALLLEQHKIINWLQKEYTLQNRDTSNVPTESRRASHGIEKWSDS
jgi:hypothetical protein